MGPTSVSLLSQKALVLALAGVQNGSGNACHLRWSSRHDIVGVGRRCEIGESSSSSKKTRLNLTFAALRSREVHGFSLPQRTASPAPIAAALPILGLPATHFG